MQCLGLHTWCSIKNKLISYTPMYGSSNINVSVYIPVGGSPKNMVKNYKPVVSWVVKDLQKFDENSFLS